MTRERGEKISTMELDARSLRGLLELEAREPGPTVVMERERLLRLVDATMQPIVLTKPNTIPRTMLPPRERTDSAQIAPLSGELTDERAAGSVSPLYVLFVLGMLVTVFIAIIQL